MNELMKLFVLAILFIAQGKLQWLHGTVKNLTAKIRVYRECNKRISSTNNF